MTSHLNPLDPLLSTLADVTLELHTHGRTVEARRLLQLLAHEADVQALRIGLELEQPWRTAA